MRKDINMQRLIQLIILIAWFSVSILMMCTQVYADLLDSIQILKISPRDERAVIKTSDRELKIIKVGDVLQVQSTEFKVQSPEIEMKSELSPKTTELKVIEIAKVRVVLEENTEKGIETVIIRFEDGKQRIERIKKTPDKQPLLYKPQADIKD